MSENITFQTSVPTSPAKLRFFRFINVLLNHLNIHKLLKIAKLQMHICEEWCKLQMWGI